MTSDLYIKYKADTGEDPIIEIERFDVMGTEVNKTIELMDVCTDEDEYKFYTCDYVKWLEEKLTQLTT